LNLIFAGTPEFAVPSLNALIVAGHDVVMVLTQPDRPAGRGMKLKASPVKELAIQHGLNVFQPESLKPLDIQAQIAAVNADVMIVAAYGLIIPTLVLNMPKLGCYNIHASLLPRWRGAAPIHRALLAGDAETGVTIMEVVPALDAGAMISHGAVVITEQDTTQTLHDALSAFGAKLMVATMNTLVATGKLSAQAQDESLVTYAHKLTKAEAAIDWSQPADLISRQVRGFNPFPVAHSIFNGEVCRLWMATVADGEKVNAKNGEVVNISAGIVIACGAGLLKVTELQMPSGKRMDAKAFIQSQHLKIGNIFS